MPVSRTQNAKYAHLHTHIRQRTKDGRHLWVLFFALHFITEWKDQAGEVVIGIRDNSGLNRRVWEY